MYSVVAPGKGHMIPTLGTSYIQIVGFDDDGPVARALLAYSESSDPASPHVDAQAAPFAIGDLRSEEHKSELQSLMRNSYAVFCLKNKKSTHLRQTNTPIQSPVGYVK